jgi:hypothetical protein
MMKVLQCFLDMVSILTGVKLQDEDTFVIMHQVMKTYGQGSFFFYLDTEWGWCQVHTRLLLYSLEKSPL